MLNYHTKVEVIRLIKNENIDLEHRYVFAMGNE